MFVGGGSVLKLVSIRCGYILFSFEDDKKYINELVSCLKLSGNRPFYSKMFDIFSAILYCVI